MAHEHTVKQRLHLDMYKSRQLGKRAAGGNEHNIVNTMEMPQETKKVLKYQL